MILISLVLAADWTPAPTVSPYDQCMGKAQSQSDKTSCAGEDADRQTRRLDDFVTEQIARGKAGLEVDQRKWLGLLSTKCPDTEGNLVDRMNHSLCVIAETKKRATALGAP